MHLMFCTISIWPNTYYWLFVACWIICLSFNFSRLISYSSLPFYELKQNKVIDISRISNVEGEQKDIFLPWQKYLRNYYWNFHSIKNERNRRSRRRRRLVTFIKVREQKLLKEDRKLLGKTSGFVNYLS